MADFDADKQLVLFEEDVGFKINAVAYLLQFQSDEMKEQNWQKFSNGKEELTTFVEIYTILFGLIALTLNAKQLSNKPSKNTIKALTIKLLPKLPKSDTNEPQLTKSCFMTNLHDFLHEIHTEAQDSHLLTSSNAPSDDQKHDNDDGLVIQAKKSDIVLEAAWNASEKQIEIEMAQTLEPNTSTAEGTTDTAIQSNIDLSTLSVGSICRCRNFVSDDGVDYDGKYCTVDGQYQPSLQALWVTFKEQQTATMYVAVRHLEYMPPDAHPELYGPKASKGEGGGTADADEESFVFDTLIPGCMECTGSLCSKCADFVDEHDEIGSVCGHCFDYTSKAWWCRMVIMLICVIIAAFIIDEGRRLVKDGKEYEVEATQETCAITGWTRDECTFECDCSTYEQNYDTQYVYKCDTDDDDDDTCHSYEYLYKATASRKCDNTELSAHDIDVEGCGAAPRNVSSESSCWVLDCEDREFAFREPTAITVVGRTYVSVGAVWIVAIVLICMCCGKYLWECCC